MTRKKGKEHVFTTVAVLFISLVALAVSLVLAVFFKDLESQSVDLRMRWRYRLSGDHSEFVNHDIALLAVDQKTLGFMGRFGAGRWLSRRAYFDQLSFFRDFLQPSVLSYDIIFSDAQGLIGHSHRVTESADKINEIIEGLEKVASGQESWMPVWMLDDMNRFSMEQGNSILAFLLADIKSLKKFKTVLAYHFRGGAIDSQSVSIPEWNDKDVFGNSKTGNEEEGRLIPYLKDISIPSSDIHFQSKKDELCYQYSHNANMPNSELLDYASLGSVNCPRDEDSIVRRIPLVLGYTYTNSKTGQTHRYFVPTFSLLTFLLHMDMPIPLRKGDVEIYMGDKIVVKTQHNGEYDIPIDSDGRMFLNFTVKLDDFPAKSFVDAAVPSYATSKELRDKFGKQISDALNGKMVFVGVTSTGIDDGAYPLSSDKPTPLIHVHLTAVNNIMNRCFLRPLKRAGTIILWVCLFCIFTGLCVYEKTARLGFTAVLAAVLYFIVAYTGIHMSMYVFPLIGPLSYIGLGSFAVMTLRFFTEERARRRIRGMFSTMVSERVLSYLEESPESFSLKGENVEASVFFSDIEGFTGISESLPPEKLTDLLNSYLTPVTDCVLENGGYLDKYVGDGVMAVWGAPYPDPQHAIKACKSAIQQQSLIADMNKFFSKDGLSLHVRMGINSGIVTAGNMGSERKFQYTVMGDVVNLASRLEPVNKDFKTSIIISEHTYKHVKDFVEARLLAKIIVSGRVEREEIYELLGEKGCVDESVLHVARMYEDALSSFFQREWSDCVEQSEIILSSVDDPPSLRLLEEAKKYSKNPPSPGWHGEYVRFDKN